MRNALFLLGLATLAATGVVACGGDDTMSPLNPPSDGGADVTVVDGASEGGDAASPDASSDATFADATSDGATFADATSDDAGPDAGPPPTDATLADATSDDAGPDAGPPPTDGGTDTSTPDADAAIDASEGGTISTNCIDLSGQYQENDDVLTLTRPNCGSLTWYRAASSDGTPAYTHAYTTDGVARSTTDETGAPITETATVDDVAMRVHRTYTATGVDEYQTVSWTLTPCTLLDPQGVYLLRVTNNDAGQQTNCEFWSYDDPCVYPTKTCVADPADKCQTNIATDIDNCGACGVVCGTLNTTNVVCRNNACALTCAQGFANCTGALSDGCETNLTTVSNCGACNNVCGSAGTTSSTCTSSGCAIVCDATHADCDGLASNGCETDITVSPWACGGCGIDCAGALCASSQCVSQGKTLATGVTWPVNVQVDGANLYYYQESGSSLYAIDKVNGGTAVPVATNVGAWVAAGDGTVYFASQSDDPYTISRWVGAGSPTQPLATLSGLLSGLLADSGGVVWSDVVDSADGGIYGYRDSALRAWSPGDAAPHTLYLGVEQMGGLTAAGMTSTYVVATINGPGTILDISRASGTAQTIASDAGYLVDASAIILGSTVYLTGIVSSTVVTVPLSGGTLASWFTGSYWSVATDGTSFFISDPTGTYADIEELPTTAATNPTPVPLAYGAPYVLSSYYPPAGPPFTVDATTIYLWDATRQQIRAVAR
jgi:hypothetical protein